MANFTWRVGTGLITAHSLTAASRFSLSILELLFWQTLHSLVFLEKLSFAQDPEKNLDINIGYFI